MKNFDAHSALVAAAEEMRARRISDDRTLSATVNARRAIARRNEAMRARFNIAHLLIAASCVTPLFFIGSV